MKVFVHTESWHYITAKLERASSGISGQSEENLYEFTMMSFVEFPYVR